MSDTVAQVDVLEVAGGDDLTFVKTLFVEYAENQGYERCFADFDAELADLPGPYAPPDGNLWLARVDGAVAGCIAVKRAGPDTAEMKRLYVRPQFRGHSLGTLLVDGAVSFTREAGYRTLVLETVAERMRTARHIYRQRGFVERAPLDGTAVEGVITYELAL